MKLYTNNKGGWAGTQADARKNLGGKEGYGWICLDVPTDKPKLIAFLQQNQVQDPHVSGARKLSEAMDQASESITEGNEELASSYFAWALDKLQQGDLTEAKSHLRKGLSLQRGAKEND